VALNHFTTPVATRALPFSPIAQSVGPSEGGAQEKPAGANRRIANRTVDRRNAEKAMRPVDREAWLRLAADWAQLAEGAGLMERKGNPVDLRK
jgi:hypothetical protein